MPLMKITNNQPKAYSVEQLFRDNPNTSFPATPSLVLLEEWEVYPYVVLDYPTCDTTTQTIIALGIEQVDGVWTQGWAVQPLPIADAGRNVRAHRNNLLSETDWMALSDNTITPEWAAYRQALRDVSLQVNFPYSVIWPNKPE